MDYFRSESNYKQPKTEGEIAVPAIRFATDGTPINTDGINSKIRKRPRMEPDVHG